MTNIVQYGIAALLLVPMASAAVADPVSVAQENAWHKPQLVLSAAQTAAIQEAVGAENSYQPTPAGFEAEVGATVSNEIAPHPLPRPLIYEIEALKNYSYSKLDRNVLIVDPMSNKIVQVMPRLTQATMVVKVNPEAWAATRGREMLGLSPLPVSADSGAASSNAASGPVQERRGIQQAGADKTAREAQAEQDAGAASNTEPR